MLTLNFYLPLFKKNAVWLKIIKNNEFICVIFIVCFKWWECIHNKMIYFYMQFSRMSGIGYFWIKHDNIRRIYSRERQNAIGRRRKKNDQKLSWLNYFLKKKDRLPSSHHHCLYSRDWNRFYLQHHHNWMNKLMLMMIHDSPYFHSRSIFDTRPQQGKMSNGNSLAVYHWQQM